MTRTSANALVRASLRYRSPTIEADAGMFSGVATPSRTRARKNSANVGAAAAPKVSRPQARMTIERTILRLRVSASRPAGTTSSSAATDGAESRRPAMASPKPK